MTTNCCSPKSATEPTSTRLPTNVHPLKYWIDYDVIDLMNFRFEANERVLLQVHESTTVITCHAVELCVFDVSVEIPRGTEVEAPVATEAAEAAEAAEATEKLVATKIEYLAEKETVSFHFAKALPLHSTITLSLRLHGFLNDKERGFFRTEYDADSEKRPMAATQFEPCDARRAFVCWDEPAVKARFQVSMVTDASLTVLSNTPVVETTLRPKKNALLCKTTRGEADHEKLWRFEETPVMSTYLVAMAVGEFDSVTETSAGGVVISVYTQPTMGERGRFALGVTVRALEFFTERFRVPYPLKKLDVVGIPNFGSAMENWGLVTIDALGVCVDETNAKHMSKVVTARVICHELAHQWFGNIVTMDWWTGLWLNEGFAVYMEYAATNALFPEWNVWDSFALRIQRTALTKDAMVSSHPVEVEVHRTSEIYEAFDTIAYCKGACVVRMLGEFLGHDVFFKGVHDYLVEHSYGNTTTEDLWVALERVSGLQIASMANSWTKQTGFPVVTISEKQDGSLALTQQRFFSNPRAVETGDPTRWDIPLTAITSSYPTEPIRIGVWDAKTRGGEDSTRSLVANSEITQHLNAAIPAGTPWVKLNPGQTNFYLVNYPPAMWKQLQTPVKDKIIRAADRLDLLSGAFMLVKAGALPVGNAFDFVMAYAEETEHACWNEIASTLIEFAILFESEPFYPAYQEFVRKLFAASMKRLTWDVTDEDQHNANASTWRSTTIASLGAAGDMATIQESQRRAQAYLNGNSSALSSSIRRAALVTYMRHAPVEEARKVVDQLRARYDAADLPDERLDLLVAMGHVPDVNVKLDLLDWSFSKDGLKSFDLRNFLDGSTSGAIGVRVTWDYIATNYDAIEKTLSGTKLGELVTNVVGNFWLRSQADEVERFTSTKNTSAYQSRLDTALETIRLRSDELDRDRDAAARWFQQQSDIASR